MSDNRTGMSSIVVTAYNTAYDINAINGSTIYGTENHHVGIRDSIHTAVKGTCVWQRCGTDRSINSTIQINRSSQTSVDIGMSGLNHICKPAKLCGIT